MDDVRLDNIDPALDECCRREEESIRRGNALRRTLERFDVVAEKERRRRNLVATNAFQGCRCCYDPNVDGGEYRALMELRESQGRENGVASGEVNSNQEVYKEQKQDNKNENDDEFDYLLDEDINQENEALKALEDQRRAELEMEIFSQEIAIQHGYGAHRQLHPTRILRAAGLASGARDPPPAVVLHLVDPDSMASASLDLCLENLAANVGRGTKFMRSGGRSTLLMNTELAEKVLPHLKPDTDLPALVAIKDGVAVNVCPRLLGLISDHGRVDPDAVEMWLDRSGVLLERPPTLEAICRIRPEEEALMDYLASYKPNEGDIFECGIPGCTKSFAHEHVGVKTENQSGLVLSEEEAIGE